MINLSSKKVNAIHLLFGYFLSLVTYSFAVSSSNTFFPETIARLAQLFFIFCWLFFCFYDYKDRIFSQLITEEYINSKLLLLLFALLFLAINFRIAYEAMIYHFIIFFNIKEEIPNPSEPLPYSLDLILAVCVIGPLIEEVFYRAALINSFHKKHSLYVSVFISSLIFALLHLNPFVFVVGLMLSFIYIRFGIVASVVFHSISNLALIFLKSSGFYSVIMTFQGVVSFITVLASVFICWKKTLLKGATH